MISFLIPIKDETDIDLETLKTQIQSCLRVRDAKVLIGLSTDRFGTMRRMRDDPAFLDPNVECTITDDTSLYDGWNKLLKLARSELVSFLGLGDCILVPQHFENFPEDRNINALFSRVLIYDDTHSRVFGKRFIRWRHRIKQEAAFSGAVFRKQLFDKEPFDASFKVVGDYEWMLRCAKDIRCSFRPLVTVTMPAGGMSESLKELTRKELVQAKQ